MADIKCHKLLMPPSEAVGKSCQAAAKQPSTLQQMPDRWLLGALQYSVSVAAIIGLPALGLLV